jgi:hypothetical protein
MGLDSGFSKRTKELIGFSREIAIELGYDYISTLHFLIADCKSDYTDSIRNFAFETDSDFNTFYKNQDVGKPSLLHESLPLTLEAEETVRLSVQLWHRTYIYEEIQPYHIFLAAGTIENSFFRSLFSKEIDLVKELEKYYLNIGTIKGNDIHQSFFQKLIRKWRY